MKKEKKGSAKGSGTVTAEKEDKEQTPTDVREDEIQCAGATGSIRVSAHLLYY